MRAQTKIADTELVKSLIVHCAAKKGIEIRIGRLRKESLGRRQNVVAAIIGEKQRRPPDPVLYPQPGRWWNRGLLRLSFCFHTQPQVSDAGVELRIADPESSPGHAAAYSEVVGEVRRSGAAGCVVVILQVDGTIAAGEERLDLAFFPNARISAQQAPTLVGGIDSAKSTDVRSCVTRCSRLGSGPYKNRKHRH